MKKLFQKNNEKELSLKSGLVIVALFVILIMAVSVFWFNRIHSQTKPTKLPVSATVTQNSVLADVINLETPVSRKLGLKDLLGELHSGKACLSGNLTLDHLKNTGTTVSGTSLEFQMNHDAPAKELSLDASLNYRGAKAFSMESILTPKSFLFKIPDKSDKLFSVHFDSLRKRLFSGKTADPDDNDSAYLEYLLSDQVLTSLSGDWNGITGGTDLVTTYLETIRSTYPKDYKLILEHLKKEEAEPNVYGQPGITYTLEEEGVETLMKCIINATLEDKELYQRFYPFLYYLVSRDLIQIPEHSGENAADSDAAKNNGKKTSKEIATMVDDVLYDLRSAASAFAMAYSDSISVTIWHNELGMITGLKSVNEIKIEGNKVILQLIINTKNDLNPFDNTDILFSIRYASEELVLGISRRASDDTSIRSSNHVMLRINGTDRLEIDSSQTLDPADLSYVISTNIISDAVLLPEQTDNNGTNESNESGESKISFMCSGNFSNVSQGKGLDFHIKELYINEGFTNLLTLAGDLSCTTPSEPKTLSGEKVELTEMSDEDLAKLLGLKNE